MAGRLGRASRRLVLPALVLAALLLPAAARAQRFSNITAAKLVDLCTDKNPRAVEGCTAYIDGVADTVAFYQRLRPADASRGPALPGYICIPGSVTGVQLRQTVVDWFGRHRDVANRQASGLVLRALDETFPCPGEGKRLRAE